MRSILIVHRYLAVLTGLLMSLWCLSGFVMMYQGFPALTSEARLNGLQPLELPDLVKVDLAPAGGFRVEMLLGRPVLRAGGVAPIDLFSGDPVPVLSPAQVADVARLFASGNGLVGNVAVLGVVDIDQWTLQSARRNAPAWQVALGDAARTQIYINGSTGEVFQSTNRRERVLSWFGAIPHWLYPTVLRQHGQLWTQVVVWSSVLGSFLAATGLYVGVARLRRKRGTGALGSPYRGWWYWHHISGLVFGVLVLTWVVSGLLTMNPWGVLSGRGSEYQQQIVDVAGFSGQGADLRTLLAGVAARDDSFVQLTPAPFGGAFHVMAHRQDGSRVRLGSHGEPSPLDIVEIDRAVAALELPLLEAGLIHQEDNYYYGHKREVTLPVYRAIVDDAERTRLYIDLQSGNVRSINSTDRWSRWLRTGLHDLDFPLLRLRPVWDVVVIVLLLGVTLVCATGTWMAVRRVRRDYRAAKKGRLTPQPAS